MDIDFNSDLTPQQQAFVAEYCIDFNGTRAAIAAHYSEKSVHAQASQLLGNPKIQNAIDQCLKNYGTNHKVLKQRVLTQLTNLGFSDIRNYMNFNNERIVIKDSDTLTKEQAAAIVEVKERTTKNGTTVTFKLAQKERSLELIARHLGMLTEDVYPDPLPNQKIMTFEEFCENAGYPPPYPMQMEMIKFGLYGEGSRLLLGSRGYGKTDYVVILGSAYEAYLNPLKPKKLIITKSTERNAAILAEIQAACEKAGVRFEIANSKALRCVGVLGKDHTFATATVKSVSLRGRHPDQVIMDDPVTPEDTSEATRNQVKKVYSEVCKLTSNVLLIGQPVHKYDLYEELRPKLSKMEVPHGTIPELDADLEAQRLAGVDEASIQASYFLKIISEGATPFDQIRFIKQFPKSDAAVAFIDPAFEGRDYTALTILSGYMQGVAAVGFVWKKAWNHCLDDIAPRLTEFKVKKLAFESNALGTQPLDILRQAFGNIGIVGRISNTNKHSRIMAAGMFAHMIHLSEQSHPEYIKQVVKYEYKSQFDDAPDSLASCLQWVGLIRGKM